MKSIVDFDLLKKQMPGMSVPRPLSGTLSGHATGEPFDKSVCSHLSGMYSGKIFRQYEYLNNLYIKNPDAVGIEARNRLIGSPTVLFLLSRGKEETERWTPDFPFSEKQNDTADILAVDEGFFDVIDVKTRNLGKKAQAPNIISSYKLAQVCAKMIDNEDYDAFTIDYFGIDWRLIGDRLVCEGAHHANLFKANPSSLYINWAAAMQIQFHVSECDQSFVGSMHEWAKSYLRHFVEEAREQVVNMADTHVSRSLNMLDDIADFAV